MTTFVLASASPARRSVLRAAGLDPVVRVSGVDEDAILDALADSPAAERVLALARAKALAVVDGWRTPADGGSEPAPGDDLVVLGCDSMLLLDGALQGKPVDSDDARARWAAMAGRTGDLLTGHWVVRWRDGAVTAETGTTAISQVHLGRPDPDEVEAYLATGEPLAVAGALTIDGYGGWFVDGVTGDPSNVVGVSLPTLRGLLVQVGVRVTDLWSLPDR